jgi:hypothetical protein
MTQLSPKARAMLDALQTVDSPAAEVQARAWTAVVARTAAGDLGPAIPVDASVATGATAGIGKTLVLVVGAVAVATAIGVGLVVGSDDDPAAPQRLVGGGVPAVHAPAVAPTLAPVPEDEPVLVPDDAPAQDKAIAPVPAKRPRVRSEAAPTKEEPKPADGPDALEIEMRLMAEARAALGAGDAGRAIALFKEHARQFPKGAFVVEREVSWITALCALGKTDAARSRADSFLRKHGKHPLAAKVRASCGGTP